MLIYSKFLIICYKRKPKHLIDVEILNPEEEGIFFYLINDIKIKKKKALNMFQEIVLLLMK